MNPNSAQKQGDSRPLVVSLCGTYLKPEMQSIYRQLVNLRDHRTAVFTERLEPHEQFPLESVIVMEKQNRPRAKGNFILRFWYKYVRKQWPPPRPITREPEYHPYNLPVLLRSWNPELVHVYYGHKAVKYLPMLEAWGGKFIVSFHGVDVVKFMDKPGYAEQMKRVFEKASLVLARSGSLLERVEALGCSREKLRLNHTPIPFDDIESTVRTIPSDGKWRLVQACRLIAKKGLFTTLEALEEVVKTYPELTFSVCGKGPVQDDFIRIAGERGLGGNIRVLGWLDQEALRAEYLASHVFLHPSELTETDDQEGIPNSMLEAMASGLPVVATEHGGIPEGVTHGHDGLLVSEKSPNELAAALLKLLGDAELLSALSRNAAISVRENFGLESQVRNLEACYKEACNG